MIIAAILGLCLGSFANVVIYRLQKGESVVSPPSHCMDCNTRLLRRDMVPVFSWMILRGKCRYCNIKISPRYPITEGICAILFVLIARQGADFSVLPLWCLAFVLLCVAWIDWDTMTIPDSLLIIAAIAGVCWVAFFPHTLSWSDAMIGAIAGALPLFVIDRIVLLVAKKPGFGFGDVKLMAAAGLFLGWQGIVFAYFAAFIAGGVFAVYLLLVKKAERGSYLPFGPFLCFGIMFGLLV